MANNNACSTHISPFQEKYVTILCWMHLLQHGVARIECPVSQPKLICEKESIDRTNEGGTLSRKEQLLCYNCTLGERRKGRRCSYARNYSKGRG